MKYTFEIQWPLPFNQGWKTSSKRFDTIEDAAKALAEYMVIDFDCGVTVAGRLKEVKE